MNGAPNIFFTCNFCGTSLSVPATMAGISGPCPKCGNRIVAPHLPTVNKINPAPRLAVAPKLSALVSNHALHSTLPTAHHPPKIEPMPVPTQIPTVDPVEPARTAYVPTSSTVSTPTHQYIPFSNKNFTDEEKLVHAIPKKKKMKISSKTVAMVFSVTFTFGTLLGVMQFLKKNKSGRVKNTPIVVSDTPIAKPEKIPETAPNVAAGNSLEAILDGTDTQESDDQQSDSSSMPQSKSREVGQMLEKFLKANNLEERKAFIESNLPEEILKESVFNKLWPIANASLLKQEPFPEMRLIEYNYHVEFAVNAAGFPTDALIVVHQYGSNSPKIYIDPLLDTIGGNLKKYAKSHEIDKKQQLGMLNEDGQEPFYQDSKTKPQQDFYCIIDARRDSYSQDIPDHGNKASIKILAYNQGDEIAVAYINYASELFKLIEDQKTKLRWNEPTRAKITLKWNLKEDPTRPFLEVIKIYSLDWKS